MMFVVRRHVVRILRKLQATRKSLKGMKAPLTACLAFMAKFLIKSRLCNYSNKDLIRVL